MSKYRWDEWFVQGEFTIKRGVDYEVSQSTMYQTVRNNASLRGLLVKIKDLNNGLTVRVIGVNKHGVPNTDKASIIAQYKDALDKDGKREAEAEESSEERSKGRSDTFTTTTNHHNAHRTSKAR